MMPADKRAKAVATLNNAQARRDQPHAPMSSVGINSGTTMAHVRPLLATSTPRCTPNAAGMPPRLVGSLAPTPTMQPSSAPDALSPPPTRPVVVVLRLPQLTPARAALCSRMSRRWTRRRPCAINLRICSPRRASPSPSTSRSPLEECSVVCVPASLTRGTQPVPVAAWTRPPSRLTPTPRVGVAHSIAPPLSHSALPPGSICAPFHAVTGAVRASSPSFST